MIRKDQLPNIWGDNWEPDSPSVHLQVDRGEHAARHVLCDTADRNIFRLDQTSGLTFDEIAGRYTIDIAEGASLELYVLQFTNTKHNRLFNINMQAHSCLKIGVFTLGGEHMRTGIVVRMQGEGCEVDANGLYLIDRDQQCDNYIFIEHALPHCTSHTLYKGIVDDSAHARFNGHVLVQDGAVKTEAHQTNRNILLTDKAHVDTRPFLEIYNDDVKCSHGSTIGQLDEQALFYLQTRGISQRTAITMLSYAFCDEVVRTISIDPLREAIGDIVKKRLHGELTPCAECATPCATPCNGPDANFAIDPSKL